MKHYNRQAKSDCMGYPLDMHTTQLIIDNDYVAILNQDGWETLELTIYENHSRIEANSIMNMLENMQ